MNPWMLLAAIAVVGGAYGLGRFDQHRMEQGAELRAERAAQRAGEAATTAAVEAIKGIKPKFTTINKAVERETRTEVRYTDAGCRHTDAAWRLLDSAYQAAGGEPFSGGTGVPAPDPAP